MKQFLVFLSLFSTLAISRFIPHPPNFTSLIALSLYVPIFLGLRYLPVLLICFIVTDLVIGYHNLTHWTWGSVFFIGLLSTIFSKNLTFRIFGGLLSAFVFFIITNFGVWLTGMYGLNIEGLVKCYIVAIPFFGNLLISTLVFSILFEITLFFYAERFKNILKFTK